VPFSPPPLTFIGAATLLFGGLAGAELHAATAYCIPRPSIIAPAPTPIDERIFLVVMVMILFCYL
jgi:hypothetical protein